MKTAYERVLAARDKNRPTAVQYINAIFHDFIELHGDRRFGDDRAIIAGLAYLKDRPITVVGIERGTDTQDRIARNFGSAHPEGYRKALRLMREAEKFHRPVICLVDTSGGYCGIGAEERGQGQAIAENLKEIVGLKTPVISLLIGEGGSGGALALCVGDEVWMLENSVYSVISPEGAASILFRDGSLAAKASEDLRLTAQDLKSFAIVERVFDEPEGDFQPLYDELREAFAKEIDWLSAMTSEQLLEKRFARYRKMGGVQ